MSSRDTCPKCGARVDEGASMCGACDYVLDPSELVEISDGLSDDDGELVEIASDDVGEDDGSERAQTGGRYGGDALILGKLGDDFDAILSDQTGAFPIDEGQRVLEPAPVYLAHSVQAMTASNAVLAFKEGVDRAALSLNPFERAIAELIDGERPVARIRTKLAVSANDLTVGLAMLADRGVLVVRAIAKPSDLRAMLAGDLDESLDEIALESVANVADDTELTADANSPGPRASTPANPFNDVADTSADLDLDDPVGDVSLAIAQLPDAGDGPSPFDEPPEAVVQAEAMPLVLDLPLDALTPLPLPDDAITAVPVPAPVARNEADMSALERAMLDDDNGPSPVRPAASTRPLSATMPKARPVPATPIAAAVAPARAPAFSTSPPASTTTTTTSTPTTPQKTARYDPAARQKAEMFAELALKDLREGKKARAFSYAKMAAGIDPEEPTTKALLADWANAEQIAQASSEDQKLVAAASEAESKGDFKRAVELLRKALVLRPKEAELHNRIGVLLATRLQDLTGGTSELMKAVELDPKNVAYRSNLGKVFKLAETKR